MVLLFKLPTSYGDVFKAYQTSKELYQYCNITVFWKDRWGEGFLEKGYIYDFAINGSKLDVLVNLPKVNDYISMLNPPISQNNIQEIDNKLFLNCNNE